MTTNHELQLTDALMKLFEHFEWTYSSGGTGSFAAVLLGDLPDTSGYPSFTVIPSGPVFSTEVLGGQEMHRKDRNVLLNLVIVHEHHDKELGIREMSDILWAVVEEILKNPRLANAESMELGEIEYSYEVQDKNDNLLGDWGYKGAANIPLIATWRYRR